MLKQTIIGAVVSAIVAVVAVLLIQGHSMATPSVTPSLGNEVRAKDVDVVTYNSIQSVYRSNGDTNGGLRQNGGNFTQATTTVCAIQSPAATSTLRLAMLKFDVSSTSASVVTIAKSNTPYATTTILGTQYAITAGSSAFIQASTSPSATTATVFAPNQYLVASMQGGVGGNFSPSGYCVAEWASVSPNN